MSTSRADPAELAPIPANGAYPPEAGPAGATDDSLAPFANDAPESPLRRLVRRARAIRRLLLIVMWTLVAAAIQSVLLMLPGRAKASFARFYWSVVSLLLGMRIRVIGAPIAGRMHDARAAERRPVVYVSNHSSWLDVPVLGGRLVACFVAKDDVASWPAVSTVARLGRTFFVSRQRANTGRERTEMRQRLSAGDDLILFPEGTSSDGTRVLPFHSSFFAIADCGADAAATGTPLVQPVSIVFDRLGGLPVGHKQRPIFAWYGDMSLAPHVWQLAQHRSMRATILLHPPLDPVDFDSRKSLSRAAYALVADGMAALRQNRMG